MIQEQKCSTEGCNNAVVFQKQRICHTCNNRRLYNRVVKEVSMEAHYIEMEQRAIKNIKREKRWGWLLNLFRRADEKIRGSDTVDRHNSLGSSQRPVPSE